MSLTLDRAHLKGFVSDKDYDTLLPQIKKAHSALKNKKGAGSEYTGWVNLPEKIEDSFLTDLEELGAKVRAQSDCLISIGIGGSYLGIRATVEFLRESAQIPIHYVGHNMSTDYLYNLLEKLRNKNVSVVVISKSGSTTEPALAFRIVKQFLKDKYGEGAMKDRIICITDAKKGALRKIANEKGYRSFVVPDDVGGRFSVLTPVGLVPLAMVGVDIRELVKGARKGQKEYSVMDLSANISYQYAASRYLLLEKQKAIEVTASFYDNLQYVMEWWKQLYGESEAKDGKGLFPASLVMSTDLHSMGQLMQDGIRNVFETFLNIENTQHSFVIPKEDQDLDGFNVVADKELDWVNKQAYKATAEAHYEGGVPNMTLHIPESDAFNLGQLYYFYERAVSISGYLLGVNPFNQPGVEAYKKKMFALLGKA